MWPFRKNRKTRRSLPGVIRARFDAAQTTAENARHWAMADGLSADSAGLADVRKRLRERARYEVANNSFAKGIALKLANDCVGTGPRLQMLLADDAANRKVETAFWLWCQAVGLSEKLRTMRLAKVADGEAFAILTINPLVNAPVQIDVHLVEADQVESPWGYQGTLPTPSYIDGIALDDLCNGNVRQMMNMVKAFLCFCGLNLEGVFTASYLSHRDEATLLTLTANFDTFLRAIIVGNHCYYSVGNPLTVEARETFILNLLGGPPGHILLPLRILTYIKKFDIVHKAPLLSKAACMGINKSVVQAVLQTFLDTYLVESMQGTDSKEVAELIVTRKGRYYHDYLSRLATYLICVLNDTVWDQPVAPYEISDPLGKAISFLLGGIGNYPPSRDCGS